MPFNQALFLGVVTLTFATAAVSAKASAEGSNVTHVIANAWQSSDFHDPVNPGCSIGGNGSMLGGRIVMGASQRQPSPMSLVIRKQGWAIPAGTPIQVRAVFPDASTMDFAGSGLGQTISIDLDASRLPAWVHSLTANSTMQLVFAGAEPLWRFDLAGTSKVVNAMSECFVAHHIEGVAPPFSSSARADADKRGASATQPFGGTLPALANGTASMPQPASTSSIPKEPVPSTIPATTRSLTVAEGSQSMPTAPSQPSNEASPVNAELCKNDWKRCTDNSDLVNNYKGYWEVQSHCEDQANHSARYGTPKWPGFWSGGSFSRFRQGSDYVRTGVVTAIEPDVQFQNGFGAMVHSTAVCKYDLKAKSVLSVDVVPNG